MKGIKATLLLIVLCSCQTEFDSRFCPSLANCVSSFVFTTFYTDNFNRADESPIASPWNHVQGSAGDDFELLTNTLNPKRGAGASPTAFYNTAVTTLGVRVRVTAKVAGAGFPGATAGEIIVWARSQSSTNTDNGYFCGIDPTSKTITIGRTLAGAGSPIASSSSSFTLANGDSFSITFTLTNNNIECSITRNGSTTIDVSTTDDSFTTGFAGLQGGKNGADELEFDDFILESGSQN